MVQTRPVIAQTVINMEKIAVCHAIKYLHDNEIIIKELVTDASTSVKKMLGKYVTTSI